MNDKQIDAIRARDRMPQRSDEDVTEEHAQAAADRRALLEYIDELAGRVHELGVTVSEALATMDRALEAERKLRAIVEVAR